MRLVEWASALIVTDKVDTVRIGQPSSIVYGLTS